MLWRMWAAVVMKNGERIEAMTMTRDGDVIEVIN